VAYTPRKGDLIAITLDPQAGHEQRGRRPALVCMACPITNTPRDYPFHVHLPEGHNVTGFVMVEQIKSIDFRARRAKRIGKAPAPVLEEALSILDACIY